jgi:hypothetical protein
MKFMTCRGRAVNFEKGFMRARFALIVLFLLAFIIMPLSSYAIDRSDSGGGVKAVSEYIEWQARGTRDLQEVEIEQARRRKFLDTFYSVGIQQLKNEDEYFSKAIGENAYLNSIATTAASVFGGPGGAAAYAAWYAYKVTGDMGLALKTGVITGASSAALGKVKKKPPNKMEQKALLAGAIGGAAIAASGGDSDKVWDSFLNSGGMVLVQDGFKEYVGAERDVTIPVGAAYCLSSAIGISQGAEELDCLPPQKSFIYDESNKVVGVDIQITEHRRPRAGLWSAVSDGGDFFGVPRESEPVTYGLKVSGVDAMEVARNKLEDSWKFKVLDVATVPPAIIVTYVGVGAPTYGLIGKANRQQHEQVQRQGEGGAGTVPPVAQENAAAVSAICARGTEVKIVVVDAPSAHPDYACRVIYETWAGVEVPWYANSDPDWCLRQAEGLLARHLESEWACMVH